MSWYLLAAIPVFGLLVIGHEFGHFIAAKWAGIRVEEFALGFPPRLFAFKRGETTYAINALPLGGYVRMPGENGEMTDENGNFDPGSFASKPAYKRLIVLLAGVTMNIILAFLRLTTAAAIGSPNPYALIDQVNAGSPAAKAGIQHGDRILSVDGKSITYFSDFQTAVDTITSNAPAKAATIPITVEVQHPGAAQPVTLTVNALVNPDVAAGQGHFGVTASYDGAPWQRTPIWQAPGVALQDMGTVIVTIVELPGNIIRGHIALNQAVT